MAEGIQIRVTHLGLISESIYVDDIRSDIRQGLPNEGNYIPAGGFRDWTYQGLVPLSFESGDIRTLINQGHVSTQFIFGAAFNPSGPIKMLPVEIDFTDSPYAASSDEVVLVDATGGVTVVNLPNPGTLGEVLSVKKVDVGANAVTLNGNGNNIDGVATQPIAVQWESLMVMRGATQWYII